MKENLGNFYYNKYKDSKVEDLFNKMDNNTIHQLLLELSLEKSKK